MRGLVGDSTITSLVLPGMMPARTALLGGGAAAGRAGVGGGAGPGRAGAGGDPLNDRGTAVRTEECSPSTKAHPPAARDSGR